MQNTYKKSNNTEQKPLPEWFNGDVYPKGGTVRNVFTGVPAELNANELSMYNLIRKGIDWFRAANPEAYNTQFPIHFLI